MTLVMFYERPFNGKNRLNFFGLGELEVCWQVNSLHTDKAPEGALLLLIINCDLL
ncbi:MAG: hypothetical protein Aureis2KO_32770 [Aureisphaera sp.]